MPQLRPRQEAFARAVIKSAGNGASQAACYASAGYSARGHAAEVNASRLLKNAEVKMRVAELAAPAVKKTGLSLESLALRIGRAIERAEADNAHGAIASNHALLLKIAELVRDEPVDYSELDSVRDHAEAMVKASSDGVEGALEYVDLMREALLEIAADNAREVGGVDSVPQT
jgi:phage terminase small subunit